MSMRKTLEGLWNEYLAEKCAVMDTEEERVLAKEALKKHKIANDLLTKEQSDAIEAYIDTLCEMQESFVKKAFFKGCRFATAFLIEFSEKA